MMETKVENPWDVKSIYEFYHFNCPTCLYKHSSKQDFVNHVANTHPESVDYLKNLSDGSLCDIETPWKSEESDQNNFIVKKELDEDGNIANIAKITQDTDYYPSQFLETQFGNPKWDSNDFDYDGYNSEDFKTELMDNNDENDEDYMIETLSKKKNHKRQKDYECDSCSKSFSLAKSLKRHKRVVHEGLKDFKCDSCSKSFAHRHHLKKHMENVSTILQK